jgi:Asp-tRNA(Asn)/Glu-tRNA(Gln) amidotransferase A subunit family amidase
MKLVHVVLTGALMLPVSSGGEAAETKPFQLDEASISGVQAAYRSGATTAARVVQSYLARIRAYDQAGPKLNVVIFLNPRALDEAVALDEHLRETGKFVGPLHGIPVLLKDNINTKDMPTTGDSLSLAGYTPATDAAITRKLRSAGAIILAKVNLHEFAIWGETVSSVRGQTLNPYDLTRTPDGSSGGTGAGVAANFAVAGIGTDTVNSIRSPASANSIVGIRPTLGLVSRAGVIPYSFTQDAAGSGRFHPNIEENIKKSQSLEMDDGYRMRLQKRSELQQRVMQIMADDRLDAIVFPHQKRLVVPVGETQVERNGALGSVTGFPSIVVPGGFSSSTATAALGVPVGIEFLGRPWTENVLIEIGYGYEQATKHRRPPPTTPPL